MNARVQQLEEILHQIHREALKHTDLVAKSPYPQRAAFDIDT